MMVRFSKSLASAICGAARKVHPREFIALLAKGKKGKDETVRELILLPLSVYGEDFSSIDLSMLPLTTEVCGSVHSHPDPDNRPSRGDLLFFARVKGVHAIICLPFTKDDIAVYDVRGKPLGLEIV